MLKAFLCLALTCLAALPAAAAQTPVRQQAVLVLSADTLGYPNLAEFYAGFRQVIQGDVTRPVRLYAETMDLSHFDSPAYRARLAAWYQEKYRNTPPDAILVMGHRPLQFLLEYPLWHGVPTYFALASKGAIGTLHLPPNVTGQTVDISLGNMAALATQLFPGTTRLALVGNRPEHDAYRPFSAADLRALSHQLRVIDLRGMRYEALAARLAALGPDTVIYHTTLSDDGSGRVFEPLVALEALTRAANRPTLVDVGTSVGLGPLGGIAYLPNVQGRHAAHKVMQLLAGVPPASLPLETSSSPPVFDWRQLQRWQVPDARLPASSELLFYQPTIWQLYYRQIVGALAIIVCLSVLSIALLVERRRRATAVTQSRQRLAEIAHMNRNATASVYSAAIAHELNQPLAAILSNAEAAAMMLGQPTPPLTEVREILADIQRDDRRASDLIARMRSLLKPSEANAKVVDMNALVAEALKFIAGEASMRHAGIRTAIAAGPAPVMVDPVQIQQVLINLVLNSLDAMAARPAAGRLVTVATALQGKSQVEVTVTDTGTGFAGNIEQVFESFFTTKSHGMGLGLSITAAIIQSHGGAIQASDVPGGGACVRFQLPLRSNQ